MIYIDLTGHLTLFLLNVWTLAHQLSAEGPSSAIQRTAFKGACHHDDQCAHTLLCRDLTCRCLDRWYFDLHTQICQPSKKGRYCISHLDCHTPLRCRESTCCCEPGQYFNNWNSRCDPISQDYWFTDDLTGYRYMLYSRRPPAPIREVDQHCRDDLHAHLPTYHTGRERRRFVEVLLALNCTRCTVALGMEDGGGRSLVLDVRGNEAKVIPATATTRSRVMCQCGLGFAERCDENLSYRKCVIFLDCDRGVCACPENMYFENQTYRCEPQHSLKGPCVKASQCRETLTCRWRQCLCADGRYFNLQTEKCELSKKSRPCVSATDCHPPLRCRDNVCACERTEWFDAWSSSCRFIEPDRWFTDDHTGYNYTVDTAHRHSVSSASSYCVSRHGYLPTPRTARELTRLVEVLTAVNCGQCHVVLGVMTAHGRHRVLDVKNPDTLPAANDSNLYTAVCQSGVGFLGKCQDQMSMCVSFLDCDNSFCLCPQNTSYNRDTLRCVPGPDRKGVSCGRDSECPAPLQCRLEVCACAKTSWFSRWNASCTRITWDGWFTDDQTGFDYLLSSADPAHLSDVTARCSAAHAYLPSPHTARDVARLVTVLRSVGCSYCTIATGLTSADGRRLVLKLQGLVDPNNKIELTPANKNETYQLMCQRGVGYRGSCDNKKMKCAVFLTCFHSVCLCPEAMKYDVDINRCIPLECPYYKYGVDCDKYCHCNKDEECHLETGHCPSGCGDGWTGDDCQTKVRCPDGKFGLFCGKYCHCIGEKTCERFEGSCQLGCAAGWTGSGCQTECPDWKFGLKCRQTCHCKNDEICNKTDGGCVAGCARGWTGRDCHEVCNYGLNCIKACQCRDDAICDRVNGSCPNGCGEGWTGHNCHAACEDGKFGYNCVHVCHCSNDDVCDRVNGSCRAGCAAGWAGSDCNTEQLTTHWTVYLLLSLGVCLLAFLLVCALVVNRRRRKRRERLQEEGREGRQSPPRVAYQTMRKSEKRGKSASFKTTAVEWDASSASSGVDLSKSSSTSDRESDSQEDWSAIASIDPYLWFL